MDGGREDTNRGKAAPEERAVRLLPVMGLAWMCLCGGAWGEAAIEEQVGVFELARVQPAEPAAPAPIELPPVTAEPAVGERAGELKLALDVAIVSAVSVEALKRTFEDPRPEGSGYAFPSGHATVAFALARVASEYHPKQRVLWYAIAAGVAWSRVKEDAHDWDDVIAGAALGSWIGDGGVRNGGLVLRQWKW